MAQQTSMQLHYTNILLKDIGVKTPKYLPRRCVEKVFLIPVQNNNSEVIKGKNIQGRIPNRNISFK